MRGAEEVARWLFLQAQKISVIQSVRTSPVWPPYDDESGFTLTTTDGEEFEVLVRKREVSA